MGLQCKPGIVYERVCVGEGGARSGLQCVRVARGIKEGGTGEERGGESGRQGRRLPSRGGGACGVPW